MVWTPRNQTPCLTAAASSVAAFNLSPDAARDHLARVGYDPTYGSRPLKRTIQKEIETVLGRMLLQGKVRDGLTVEVDYDGKGLTFTPAAAREPAGV